MVVLGRVVAPYGVAGWVRVHPFGDDPERWRSMAQWWLGRDAEGTCWQAYSVKGFRPHGGLWVAKFDGVDGRNAAEALEGFYVAAARESLPETAEDEFYWSDLVGLEVINSQGECLGKVASLLETGANQVLVVVDGERERLLPFVAAVVRSVDVGAGVIRVDWGGDW